MGFNGEALQLHAVHKKPYTSNHVTIHISTYSTEVHFKALIRLVGLRYIVGLGLISVLLGQRHICTYKYNDQ